MCRFTHLGVLLAAFVWCSLSPAQTIAPQGGGGLINLALEPEANNLAVGATFRVRIIARAADGIDTPFSGTQAILTWNPQAVRLLGVTNNQPFRWLFSGFIPDGDNLNDGVSQTGVPNNDGNAFYQTFPPAGSFPVATASGLHVTTLRFLALQAGCDVTLDIVPMLQSTRSLVRGDDLGEDVTGDLGSVELRITGVEGDADGDAVGNCSDACSATSALETVNAQGCSCTQIPPCNDGLFCNGVETCANGVCQAGADPCPGQPCNDALDQCRCAAAADCDDDNPCTTDTCNAGACVNTNNSAACDDGNPCTENDACAGGACAGAPLDCSGLDSACTRGICNPVSGACAAVAINQGGGCNDQNPCTQSDSCGGGVCAGLPVNCSNLEGDCVSGVCDPATGDCKTIAANEGAGCNDGVACTSNDICRGGLCLGTPGANCPCVLDSQCDDGNPCTDDSCTGNLCVFVNNADPCDDGLRCTQNDSCAAGQCTGLPVDCSALNSACNVGVCVPANGTCATQPANQGGACNDGNACTAGDVCAGGVCGGTPVDCSALNTACRVGVCNPANGVCQANPTNQGGACNDGNACTTGDVCNNGACAGTAINCSGLNDACNTGTCNPANGTCQRTPTNQGGACSDANACTTNDRCNAGVCAGTAVNCSGLNNTCNIGTCNPANGACQAFPANEGGVCNDGNACTTGDVCNGGACTGSAVNCSALNDTCNVGTCNPANGACQKSPVNQGGACDDNNRCTTNDRCAGGTCAGTPVDCSALNSTCTAGGCLQATGQCFPFPANNGGVCNDNNLCTTNDRCGGGACAGTATDCSNLNNTCNVGVCNSVNGTCRRSPANEGASCNDGLFCNGTDTCTAGNCAHSGDPCLAVSQACDEASGACFACQTNAECDDGQFCNGVESCNPVNGCQPGTAPDCAALANDGVACTDDLCDPNADGGDGACVNTADDANCDDGQFCSGTESCDPVAGCRPGTNPCTNPGLPICNEGSNACESNNPPPPPPPPASSPPPAPPATSGAVLFVQIDADGGAEASLAAQNGSATIGVLVVGGVPAARFRLSLEVNAGAPGVVGSQTFNGFAEQLALGVTLEVTEITPVLATDTIVTIELTVPLVLIDNLGLQPEQVDLHVFDEDATAWVRAGSEFVDESSPTGIVGEYGYQFNDDDTVTYWVVRDRLSVFAIGQAADGPSEPPLDPSEVDLPVDEPEPDDVGEPPAEPEPDPGPVDDPVVEPDPDLDPEIPPAEVGDPDPGVQPSPQSCGGGGGTACGAIGLVNLLFMGLGLVSLRRRR